MATANPETAATANKDLNCIARDETERKLRKKRKKKKKGENQAEVKADAQGIYTC